MSKREKTGKKTKRVIDELLDKKTHSLSPKAIYRFLKRENSDISSCYPPPPLLEADFLAVGVVTIGESIENDTIGSDNIFKNFVIDALENIALDQAKRKVADNIVENAKRNNMKTTRLLASGSGRTDWDTENQEFIFKNLESERIGVQLTPSYVIKPQKSVSFVMGLGKDIRQAKNLFSCEGCERQDCPYRV